mmetsp:Transcript_15091/g.31649  ORF Transcript_15091/g.31649 Transcript_15091/m.31649 type:complete len:215 (-) Transcript_15091:119-763(-)
MQRCRTDGPLWRDRGGPSRPRNRVGSMIRRGRRGLCTGHGPPDVVHERHQKIGHGTLHSNHMAIQIRPLGHLRTAGPTRYGMRISSRYAHFVSPRAREPAPDEMCTTPSGSATWGKPRANHPPGHGGLVVPQGRAQTKEQDLHARKRTKTRTCTYTHVRMHVHAQARTSTHKHAQARTHALKSNRTTATAPSAGPAGGTGTTAARPPLGRSVGT